jgi:hypothetical protein
VRVHFLIMAAFLWMAVDNSGLAGPIWEKAAADGELSRWGIVEKVTAFFLFVPWLRGDSYQSQPGLNTRLGSMTASGRLSRRFGAKVQTGGPKTLPHATLTD